MTTDAAAAPAPACLRRRAVGVGLALVAVGVTATAGPAQAEDYVVQPGDTVSHIALRTSTSVNQIVAANNLDARATIRIGQVLTLPTAAPAPVATAPAAASHVVVAGDTVWALARANGCTVEAITAANGLNAAATIRIGQVLTIPGGAGVSATPARTAAPAVAPTHTVVAGDTVSGLARTYGTTVAAISTANGLDAAATIRIGQVLALAGATAAPSDLVGDTFAGRTYPSETVAAANQNKATLLAAGVPSLSDMQARVAATAREMGVDAALAQAVAYQESGFNHASVSPANAIGTMQVIPTSGEWASDLVGRELNLLDPNDNVVAGVAILRSLVATSADLPTAIAGYYQGQRSVRENGMFADTRRYVANVQTLMSRFA